MINREKIIEGLLQSMHSMRHKFMVGYTVQNEFAITPSQGFVMFLVAGEGAVNTKAIASKLNISSSAATQLIDGLVDKGFLIRTESSEDRRIVTLSLSEKAQYLFEEFKKHTLHEMMGLFDVLTDDELIQFTTLNKKIVEGSLNNS